MICRSRLPFWARLKAKLQDAERLIEWAAEHFAGRLAVVTSFQREGMVILDIVSRVAPGLPILTLDTGRVPEATYLMMETVRKRYGIPIQLISPDASELDRMTTAHGPNLFRHDVGSRLLCCQIRKVRPLAKALAGYNATLVGLRREQAESRATLEQVDIGAKPIKIAPLAGWSASDVAAYTVRHSVPEHPLYSEGYTSIGCDPCTRAVASGEDERAGRWWWESEFEKECGLHFTADGQVRRRVDVLLEEVLTSRV